MGERGDREGGEVEESGANPQEEVGPAACEVGPEDCEVKVGDLDAPSHDAFFQADDELYETFRAEPIPLIIADDGLPQPVDESPSPAPPFGPDTVVCIEDDREYVELFSDELTARGWRLVGPNRWAPPALPEGQWIGQDLSINDRYDDAGKAHERRRFDPKRVFSRWGVSFGLTGEGTLKTPVRPVRERCAFYKRQNFINDDRPDVGDVTKPGSKIVFRICTARRSNGGACLSLRDEGVFACDLREPRDEESVERFLDFPDRVAIAQKRHLKMIPAFGLPGSEEERLPDAPAGGIFRGR